MKEYGHEFAEYIFYTASVFEKLGGIIPIRAGCNRAKANYFVGPRVIKCYSLHFVLDGSVSLSLGQKVVVLSVGDLFCLYPYQKYTYWVTNATTDSPLRMCWFAFHGSQAVALLERIGVTLDKPYLQNIMTSELEALLRQILDIMRNRGKDEDLKLLSYIYHMFGLLAVRPVKANLSTTTKKDWLQKCVQYMNVHFMEGITVGDVVRVAGVHRSHLYSEFQRLIGMSPRQYLLKLRMERAVEMLKQQVYTITEISLSLGYPDLYSFSRAFHNYYGMSPSRYLANAGHRSTTRQNDKRK